MLYISNATKHPETIEIFIVDSETIAQLTTESNWNSENIYIGLEINANPGQYYVTNDFLYLILLDNSALRISRKATPTIAYSENGKFKVNCGSYILVLPSLPGSDGQVLGVNQINGNEIITNWVTISGGSVSQYTAQQLKAYWMASANKNNGEAFKAFDGTTSNRWSTNAGMVNGDWFQIDLSQKALVSSINFGENGGDSGYGSVTFSDDSVSWNTLFYTITFSGQYNLASPIQARFLKFNNTKNDGMYWSIYELNVL